jgi:hypothetical protein
VETSLHCVTPRSIEFGYFGLGQQVLLTAILDLGLYILNKQTNKVHKKCNETMTLNKEEREGKRDNKQERDKERMKENINEKKESEKQTEKKLTNIIIIITTTPDNYNV